MNSSKVAPIKDSYPLPVFFAEPEPLMPLSRTESALVLGCMLLAGTSFVCIVILASYSFSRCIA